MGGQKVAPSLSLDKLPPQNIEAEQAVLGALLQNENIIPDILELVEKETKPDEKTMRELIMEFK